MWDFELMVIVGSHQSVPGYALIHADCVDQVKRALDSHVGLGMLNAYDPRIGPMSTPRFLRLVRVHTRHWYWELRPCTRPRQTLYDQGPLAGVPTAEIGVSQIFLGPREHPKRVPFPAKDPPRSINTRV